MALVTTTSTKPAAATVDADASNVVGEPFGARVIERRATGA